MSFFLRPPTTYRKDILNLVTTKKTSFLGDPHSQEKKKRISFPTSPK